MSMTIDAVEHVRKQVESYEFPFKSSSNDENDDHEDAVTLDEGLLQSYESARDKYLERNVQSKVITHALTTFDGNDGFGDILEDDEDVDDEQQQQQHVASVLQNIENSAKQCYEQNQLVKNQHELFLQKRQEFIKTLDETTKLSSSQLSFSQDDASFESMDDAEVTANVTKLHTLQEKKAELAVRLEASKSNLSQQKRSLQQHRNRLQEQAYQTGGASTTTNSLLELLQNDDNSASTTILNEIKAENATLESGIGKSEEITTFYTDLRQLLEELSGIQIISIAKAADQSSTEMDVVSKTKPNLTIDTSSSTTAPHVSSAATSDEGVKGASILFKAKLLHEYDMEMILKTTSRNEMAVFSATLVSPNTLITGVVAPTNDSETMSEPVQLQITPLDDLVAAATSSQGKTNAAAGDSVRFVLRETMARIRIAKARVVELTMLREIVELTKIVPYGGTQQHQYHQEVVCSLDREQLTAVLHLTPDCPLLPGSVYIHQLVGMGGWDASVVEDIRTTVNSNSGEIRPTVVMTCLLDEIKRREEVDGLVIPETPKFPNRPSDW